MKKGKQIISALVLLLCIQVVIAQHQDKDLISSYEDYTEMDRELVYAHLNKSIYIKGETIGVKAYILDKYTKELVNQATNLYCTISNDTGNVISSKLFMVTNGTAVGDFDIDDTFTSGHYTIKLYTNWMRNFNEQNLFVETIRIIDPTEEKQLVTDTNTKQVDAQFLPEGGHMIYDVENTLGIVIKNEKGFGLSYVKGEIVDQDNVVVTNFKVNQFGLGKCLLTPQTGTTYRAKFEYNDVVREIDIKGIKSEGIAMNLSPLKDKVALSIKTNNTTLQNINKDIYKLAIHNGQDLKEISFKFDEKSEIVKVIPKQDLFSGVNIFTIFDSNNNPILERIYFNFNGIDVKTSSEAITTSSNDSILITLPYKLEAIKAANAFSVSVLPSGTNSYHHQNIASYALLQPYVKGYVEQAHYYFTEVSAKKQFELDNLLITQGWSSYDWDEIFNNPPEYDYDYENGISYTLNSPDKGDKQLMIYPSLNHTTKLISLSKDNAFYTTAGLFPVEDETIRIREITTSGKPRKPNLYIQFDPIKIPEVDSHMKPLTISALQTASDNIEMSSSNLLKKVEQLDEVIVTSEKGYTEIEKLQNRSLGKVEAIDETLVKRYRTLVRYLRDKGWTVADTPGKFEIYNNQNSSLRSRSFEQKFTVNGEAILSSSEPQTSSTPTPTDDDHTIFVQNGSSIPIVYLDGMILHEDLTILRSLTLDQIEWVEVNKSGVGGGMRSGGAGLIRIKTRPNSNVKVVSENVYGSYDIPLKFSVARKFYIPRYASYNNEFFNRFGIVDWLPNLKLNAEGNLEFKIADKQLQDFKIIVEGIHNNTFISEVKSIKLN